MINGLTIDLEEWFCSHNLKQTIHYSRWEKCERRVEKNTNYLLDLFDKHQVRATFFVLGWVAERYPELVEEIKCRGHEIGTHGFAHQLVNHLNPESFKRDLYESIEVITRITGEPVTGFRAPAFSINNRTIWAVQIIKNAGLLYDSSVYPIAYHPDYGMPDAPLHLFSFENGLVEIPMSCVTYGRRRIPCSGGGYFRLLPYWVYHKLTKELHRQQRPLIFYLHPWELDPDTPKVRLSATAHFRHYNNLSSTKEKLERLLSAFKFTSLQNLYKIEPSHENTEFQVITPV